MAQISLAALSAELKDPRYTDWVAAGADQTIADLLNAPAPDLRVPREVPPRDILEAIDLRDVVSPLPPEAQAWLAALGSVPALRLVADDGTPTPAMRNLLSLLNPLDPNGSRARLTALATRPGSRAEQLFGVGAVVTHLDVANARLVDGAKGA